MPAYLFFLQVNIKGSKSSACFTPFSVTYQGSSQPLLFSLGTKRGRSRERKFTVTFLSNFNCSTATDSSVPHCVRTMGINTLLGLPNSLNMVVITVRIKIIHNHP